MQIDKSYLQLIPALPRENLKHNLWVIFYFTRPSRSLLLVFPMNWGWGRVLMCFMYTQAPSQLLYGNSMLMVSVIINHAYVWPRLLMHILIPNVITTPIYTYTSRAWVHSLRLRACSLCKYIVRIFSSRLNICIKWNELRFSSYWV